jgi:hypothetical protein
MLKRLIHHKGFSDLPKLTHTRDCFLAVYTDRTEIKIPIREEIKTKPVVIYDKNYIRIIFNTIDGLK